VKGGVFITPPGWWHSHHNESNNDAFVLPVQGNKTNEKKMKFDYNQSPNTTVFQKK
jgi:quercetin dioxygenase-like cupin family protein